MRPASIYSDARSADGARHPLDPLSAAEISAAVAVVRAAHPQRLRLRFLDVHLHEPSKTALNAYTARETLCVREAFLCVLDVAAGATFEAIVDLAAGALRSWRAVPGVQPLIAVEELHVCEAVAKVHPDVQAALQRRGILDDRQVVMASLGAGNFGFPEEVGRRLVLVIAYLQEDEHDVRQARLIAGLTILVDANTLEVVRIDDPAPAPLAPRAVSYREMAAANPRSDLKPLAIIQPDGPSVTLDGRRLEWQKWRMRIGFTPREALVLHQVGYVDQGRVRRIMHRASISEVVVLSADPSPAFFRRHRFEAGEFGLGLAVQALEDGSDCLGAIRYLDAVIHDSAGTPVTIPQAICIYEEDAGLLWKYTEPDGGSDLRRSRRLVISCCTTLGACNYRFSWYFYQDGTIQCEVKLTGIIQTTVLPPDTDPRYGALVLPQIGGVNYQHFFSARLDMEVDGTRNALVEVDCRAEAPGVDNPYGNAFVVSERLLTDEVSARREVDPLSARSWDVINPHVRNRMGKPVGYKLLPGQNVRLLAHPDSSIARRAAFLRHHLWATPYAASEMYAAGDYPNQHAGGAGLPAYTATNRSLRDSDLVLWYNFGYNHVVRLEEWPIMPVQSLGFSLKPVGFFDYNPAIDVPSPEPAHCQQ